MNELQLVEGQILLDNIKNTEKGLEGLQKLLLDLDKHKDNKYHDGMYHLTICKHQDGSGGGAAFTRYGGNARLLKIIIEELESQLTEMKLEFKNL